MVVILSHWNALHLLFSDLERWIPYPSSPPKIISTPTDPPVQRSHPRLRTCNNGSNRVLHRCLDVTSEQKVSESNEVSEKEWSKEGSPVKGSRCDDDVAWCLVIGMIDMIGGEHELQEHWKRRCDDDVAWCFVIGMVESLDRGHGRGCFRNFRVKWIKQMGLSSLFDLVFSETWLEAEFWENRCSWWLFWIGKDCYCSSAQKDWWSYSHTTQSSTHEISNPFWDAMRHIPPPQKHRKRWVEELHCCTVTGCKSATLLSYLPMLDFGWESHGSREWSRPGKAGCNDGDAGTGDRLSWGDEGDQGGWMVRHGHLNGDLIWISCELFSFLDFQDNFCFLILDQFRWSWFLGLSAGTGILGWFYFMFCVGP